MELLIFGYVAMMAVGVVLGSMGAGGSMLSVPILVYLLGIPMEAASAYSLFLVGVTSVTGALLKQKQSSLSVQPALWFGIPSVAGSFLARKVIICKLPKVISFSENIQFSRDVLLMVVFSTLIISSSVMLLRKKQTILSLPARSIPKLIAVGLFTGMVAGLAGAGGGFLIVPSLIIFGGLPVPAATSTSLFIVASNALFGFCGDMLKRDIDWYFLSAITALSLSGLLLGFWLQRKGTTALITQRQFAWITLTIGMLILAKEFVVGW